MTKNIELNYKDAEYKVWSNEHQRWFYLIENHELPGISSFLVTEDKNGPLYIGSAIKTNPEQWGEIISLNKLTKEELIKRLKLLSESNDIEYAHAEADSLLLKYINDQEIAEAYHAIDKVYA